MTDLMWYLGSMNDGIFIINKPPSPAGTDVGPWGNPRGPTMVINIVGLSVGKAQKIVDAHNDNIRLLLDRLEVAERQRDEARAALEDYLRIALKTPSELDKMGTAIDSAVRKLSVIKRDFDMRGANATTMERAINLLRAFGRRSRAKENANG